MSCRKIVTHKKCDTPECTGEFVVDYSRGMYSNELGTCYEHLCGICNKRISILNDKFPKVRIEYDVIEHEWEK